MKRIALVLCALAALGSSAAAFAQGAPSVPRGNAAQAVGTAQATDEAALALDDRVSAKPAGSIASGSNTFAYFVRMVVVLAVVLGAIYLVVRLLKRLSRPRAGDEAAIRVLATTGLGGGKSLHVVSLGPKAYLIGASEQAVSLIAEVDDKEYLDALALKASEAPKGSGFAELLGGMLGGKGARSSGPRSPGASGAGGQPGSSAFLAGQRERLRKL